MQSAGDDYLMGADVDYYNYGSDGEAFANTNVVDEMKAWGEWIVNDIGFDGFRIDAVKHIDSTFINEWIKHVENNSTKDLFFVGEAWVEDTATLKDYLDTVDSRDTGTSDLKVFDFPLRAYFKNMRDGNGSFDMSSLANAGLSNEYGYDFRAVSFLDNHDTSRDEGSYGKEPISKYAYQAYSYILTRNYATPSVFWKDYYQFGMKDKLDKLIKARKYYAYGAEYEHSNNGQDVYSYTREGLNNVPGTGLVLMISDGTTDSTVSKNLYTARPDVTYVDITGNIGTTVTTDATGYGNFSVNTNESKGWSIWVPQSWNSWDYVTP
jgi:alpha-amylase